MFVLVLLFFLLSSGDMIYEKIVHVLPTLSDKKRAVRIARDIEQKLSTYLFTITMINIGLGVAIGIVMWAIGMPNPLLFGAGDNGLGVRDGDSCLCGEQPDHFNPLRGEGM